MKKSAIWDYVIWDFAIFVDLSRAWDNRKWHKSIRTIIPCEFRESFNFAVGAYLTAF